MTDDSTTNQPALASVALRYPEKTYYLEDEADLRVIAEFVQTLDSPD